MPSGATAKYHGYYNAPPECWSVYTEAVGEEFGDAVLFGQAHQLTVDAYAAQHSAGPHPDKSTAVHLVGLHLVIERGMRPPYVPPICSDWPPTLNGGRTSLPRTNAARSLSSTSAWQARPRSTPRPR